MECHGNKIKTCILAVIGFWVIITAGAHAEIAGSAHDFSLQSWSDGQICKACHAPHNSDQTISETPLWNHEITTATYVVYSSATLNETVGQPLGITKLCLSCHDGTLAVDSFGNGTGSTFISDDTKVGTDLSDDHPVSFTWTHKSINPWGGADAQCMNCHDNIGEGPEKLPLPFYTYGGGPAKLECSTCHDPHNNGPPGEKLLRKTNNGSELCLWCHSK